MSDELVLGGVGVNAVAQAREQREVIKRAPLEAKAAEKAAARDVKSQEAIQKKAAAEHARVAAEIAKQDAEEKEAWERARKQKLLDTIEAYRQRFTTLKQRNKVSSKSTLDELEDEVHYIELQLGSATNQSSVGGLILIAVTTGIEQGSKYWNPLALDLTGLAAVTKDNIPQFQPIIDELQIKYGASLYSSPEMRLAMALGTLVITVHQANTDPTARAALQKANQPAKPPPGSKDL